MTDDRQAHELLGRLLTILPAERVGWLERELPNDPELRGRLLAAVSEELQETAAQPDPLTLATPRTADPMLGQRLGAFVIDARLPEQGGMGAVYRGRRADGTFAQDVAIKVIARGRDTDAVLHRFTMERRVLGRLQHPNIVRILDAGATADGRPFLVMEWIEGLRVDRFCAARRLSLTERFALFQQICTAVQYAHQHLVVHRDLKPANILIASDGTPKILDFGLAKVLEDDGESELMVSRTGERPMTPAYASPEQVRGEPITTAADVYALGVILYELLTGERPYQLKSSSATELGRVICEQVPERPSRVAERPATPAMLRPVSSQRLRGELDAIVLRALEKESTARYPTPAALSEDISRYLTGHPVLARRATLGYRVTKYVARHTKGLATAAAGVALVGVFVTQNVLHGKQLGVERDRAQASLRFLVGLFQAADPDSSKGDAITVREVLDQGVKRLPVDLKDQPETRAALLLTIGEVYEHMARFDAARPLFSESIALRKASLGPDSLELAESLNALGRVASDPQTTRTLWTQTLEIRRRRLKSDDPLLARSIHNMGNIAFSDGDYARAEAGYREAYEIFRRRNDPDRAATLQALAVVLNRVGRFQDALLAARESRDVFHATRGADHTRTLTAMNTVAEIVYWLGEPNEAERIQREVLATQRRILGDAHPAVAQTRYSLGLTLSDLGRDDEAEAVVRESLIQRRKVLGSGHSAVAYALNQLANIKSDQGEYAEAERLYNEAITIFEKTDRSGRGQSWYGLGQLFYRQAQWAEAEKYFRLDLERAISDRGMALVHRAWAETALGRLLTERGRLNEAEPLLRDALAHVRVSLPDSHWRVGFMDVLFGCYSAAKRDFAAAETQLLRGYAVLEAAGRGDREEGRYAIAALHALFDASGKPDQAAIWAAKLEQQKATVQRTKGK